MDTNASSQSPLNQFSNYYMELQNVQHDLMMFIFIYNRKTQGCFKLNKIAIEKLNNLFLTRSPEFAIILFISAEL